MKKYLIIIISLLFFNMGCEKGDQMIWRWDHPDNDPYLDLPFNEQAFIETNIPGVIGGKLLAKLPPGKEFAEGIESKIQFLNLPEGLIPEVVVNSNRNEVKISLADTAKQHNADDSIDDLVVPGQLSYQYMDRTGH